MSIFFNEKRTGPSFERHEVDCNAIAFVPPDCEVFSHKEMGRISFIPAKIELRPFINISDDAIDATNLMRQYENNSFNANLLEYLFRRRYLIDDLDEWRRCKIFFFGTLYREKNSRFICVPFLERQFWYHDDCWVRGTEHINSNNFDYRGRIALI
jgi:hypothetical protein